MFGAYFDSKNPTTLFCAAALVACLAACGDTTSYVRECVLPEDQVETLRGKWNPIPVPIALDENFSPSDRSALVAALKTWNRFSLAVWGTKTFDYGTDTSPRTTSTFPPSRSCVTVSENSPLPIKRVSSNWPVAQQDVIAVTTLCSQGASTGIESIMTGGLIEFNDQNFFGGANRIPDRQSIALHELGHVTGLKHSCEEGAQGIPSCENAPTEYLVASMYWIFDFPNGINGEIRRSTRANDQGRYNCLYER